MAWFAINRKPCRSHLARGARRRMARDPRCHNKSSYNPVGEGSPLPHPQFSPVRAQTIKFARTGRGGACSSRDPQFIMGSRVVSGKLANSLPPRGRGTTKWWKEPAARSLFRSSIISAFRIVAHSPSGALRQLPLGGSREKRKACEKE